MRRGEDSRARGGAGAGAGPSGSAPPPSRPGQVRYAELSFMQGLAASPPPQPRHYYPAAPMSSGAQGQASGAQGPRTQGRPLNTPAYQQQQQQQQQFGGPAGNAPRTTFATSAAPPGRKANRAGEKEEWEPPARTVALEPIGTVIKDELKNTLRAIKHTLTRNKASKVAADHANEDRKGKGMDNGKGAMIPLHSRVSEQAPNGNARKPLPAFAKEPSRSSIPSYEAPPSYDDDLRNENWFGADPRRMAALDASAPPARAASAPMTAAASAAPVVRAAAGSSAPMGNPINARPAFNPIPGMPNSPRSMQSFVPPVRKNPRNKFSDTNVRKQLESMPEHRIYFIWWITVVQLVILIVTLALYPIAPIGFGRKISSSDPLEMPDGTTQIIKYNESSNFWIGPSEKDLVIIGAKYAPCIRKDSAIYAEYVNPIIQSDNQTGCCISANKRCYNTKASDCVGISLTFVSNELCGGSQCCTDPAQFPDCELKPAASQTDESCKCEITGRPCCFGLSGQCVIATEEYCKSDAVRGFYHEDKILCSQVNCFEDVCGLSGFHGSTPDQWYRFILANFVHTGAIHLFFVLLFQHSIALDIERVAGWARIGIVFLISGVGGFATSVLFSRYTVTVGASGACFGLIGSLMVELFQSWQVIESPTWEFLKLFVMSLFALAFGLLPFVDNWSHIGGFTFGTLASIVFLPYITFGKWDQARKRCMMLIVLPGICGLFAVLFTLFYTENYPDCPWCTYVNCVDFIANFCAENAQDANVPPSGF